MGELETTGSSHARAVAADFGIAPEGYRLPDSTHVGSVRLQVSDLARSIAYYQGVIGFSVISSEKNHATLGAHSDQRPLVELHEQAGVRPVPRGGLQGLYHFALLLPDRPSLGRFVRHLGTTGVRAGSANHLVSESIYLWDPDRLGIEVYADRPRSEWRSGGRELVMATEPLDLYSLVELGGNERWSGLPAGTKMGHVHLHVGDLDEARKFYHSALGFDLTVWNYPGALFMSAGGYHHHLGTNTWAAGARSATEGDARLLEWELVVDDLDAIERIASNMRAAGYDVINDRRDDILTDPWGTRMRLTALKSSAAPFGV